MDRQERFKVVITAIVVRDGKFLIMQRSPNERRFPLRWTVPGGKLDTGDYTRFEKDTPHYWYNVLERALKREVQEEAGIEIKNVRYVTSLASADPGQDPSLVISCLAEYAGGQVRPSAEMVASAWVDLEETRGYDLIEGIGEELMAARRVLNGEQGVEWTREQHLENVLRKSG